MPWTLLQTFLRGDAEAARPNEDHTGHEQRREGAEGGGAAVEQPSAKFKVSCRPTHGRLAQFGINDSSDCHAPNQSLFARSQTISDLVSKPLGGLNMPK